MRANALDERGVVVGGAALDVEVDAAKTRRRVSKRETRSRARALHPLSQTHRRLRSSYELVGRTTNKGVSARKVDDEKTHPSRTTSPNGRVSLLPPRNMFQIVSPNSSASESDEKPTEPVAPPRESVTALPASWHVWMSSAMVSHLRSEVPEKVLLHDCSETLVRFTARRQS